MHILELECRPAEAENLVAELWSRGVAGIQEHDTPDGRCIMAAYFEVPIDTAPFERYSPRWRASEEQDWVEVARSKWTPLTVGQRFYLVPEWSAEPAPPGRLRLAMRPGRACGTGWAVPTQLVLELMEKVVKPGATVLDVGTGAGILSSAAALLGAGRIYACDIDHEATVIAAQRFRDENIGVRVFTGSLRSVRDASVDIVLANLNAVTLIDLAADLERIRARGGALVLGGFKDRDLARIERAFNLTAGPVERDGWLAAVS